MKIVFVRKEDYWIFPLSFVGVVFSTVFLYAGVFSFKLISAFIGFSIIYFGAYIINKNYSRDYAARYIVICAASAAILALISYLLTR